MCRLPSILRDLWRDVRGISALEFALILPVGLTLLYGTAEAGYVMLLDRKITAAVQSTGDLIAQETQVTDDVLRGITGIVNKILRPYPAGDLVTLSVASISLDPADNSTPIVDWIFPDVATSPLATGGLGIPDGLLNTGTDSIIVTSISYPYSPRLTTNVFSPFIITDRAYLRPRSGGKIAKND